MSVDDQGFIQTVATGDYQPEYLAVIHSVKEGLITTLGPCLHSIYLYGSVARGQAMPGRSDLDICVILHKPPTHGIADLLADLGSETVRHFPMVSKVDFDVGHLAEVLAPEHINRWGYWLKHRCRWLYGDDLTRYFPLMRPSKAIAVAINGDYVGVLAAYCQQITAANNLQKRTAAQRAAARKLIRATDILRTEQDDAWPEELEDYASRFIARYPQQAEAIDYFLAESQTPMDKPERFVDKLNAFCLWLEKNYQR